MAILVRRVQYFYAAVGGEPDDAYELLGQLAGQGVNLLALNTLPMGPNRMQLTLFPEEPMKLTNAARAAKLSLDGPHSALIVQGDDVLGAFAQLHVRLNRAGVDVFSTSGVTDGRGAFGYVMYMRPDDCDRALAALRG